MATRNQNRPGDQQNENAANRNLTQADNRERTVGPKGTNTAGDESNLKGSKTDLRKEEKEERPNYNHEK